MGLYKPFVSFSVYIVGYVNTMMWIITFVHPQCILWQDIQLISGEHCIDG